MVDIFLSDHLHGCDRPRPGVCNDFGLSAKEPCNLSVKDVDMPGAYGRRASRSLILVVASQPWPLLCLTPEARVQQPLAMSWTVALDPCAASCSLACCKQPGLRAGSCHLPRSLGCSPPAASSPGSMLDGKGRVLPKAWLLVTGREQPRPCGRWQSPAQS